MLEGVVGQLLRSREATVAVAESCTGGLINKMLTDFGGASVYVLGGVVSYADPVKVELLGVDPKTLEAHGAVSEPVAEQMAQGIAERTQADYGLSVTGIAGPEGGTEAKPVGTVWIGLWDREGACARMVRLPGRSRGWIREMAAKAALDQLRRKILG